MIFTDPDQTQVTDGGTEFVRTSSELISDDELDKFKQAVSINQKWEMKVPEQGGVAYIRITPQLKEFLMLCHNKHGVVGFEYDFEHPSLNLGIILKKDPEQGNEETQVPDNQP